MAQDTIVDFDEIVECGNKLYYDINPGRGMDIPSGFYVTLEGIWAEWKGSESELSFYEYCLAEHNEARYIKYQRVSVAEMRPVTVKDIEAFETEGKIEVEKDSFVVSISDVDIKNGSPRLGDQIARNPNDHSDQWLIAKAYFEDNFIAIK